MLALVRFSCGCVGTRPDESGKSLVLRECDSNGALLEPLSLCSRDIGLKSFKELDSADVMTVITALRHALRRSERYLQLLAALGVPDGTWEELGLSPSNLVLVADAQE